MENIIIFSLIYVINTDLTFLSDDLVSVDDVDDTKTVTVEAGGEEQV